MEYFLLFILQILGVGFHVMQKVISIGDKHKDKTQSEVFSTFLYEDWDTLFVSALVLFTDLVFHYIVNNYAPGLRDYGIAVPYSTMFLPWVLVSFALAFILGYAGQRLVYKFLGSTEKKINEKIDSL